MTDAADKPQNQPSDETTVTPLYTEKALPGQTTKKEAVEDPQSNIRQDYVNETERAKATANTPPAREETGEVVDADAQGVGEARSPESVEQLDPDKAVERENAKVEAAAATATEDTESAKDVDIAAKADQREADEDKNDATLDALKEQQKVADELDSGNADAPDGEQQGKIDADKVVAGDRADADREDRKPAPPAPTEADKAVADVDQSKMGKQDADENVGRGRKARKDK